jgi:hypothetical protein
MPSYTALRKAYGLSSVRRFTDITGEATDALPAGTTCDDPSILAFTQLRDEDGNAVPLGNQEDATSGVRGSTLAARLKCLYGDVDNVDAFVGMVSEKHINKTEFGALQLAIWKQQFADLRDGDRFFYANDPDLATIQQRFGIDYRATLAQIVERNTGAVTAPNVFKAA